MKLCIVLLTLALAGCATSRNEQPECASCPMMVRIPAGNAVFGSVAGALYQRPDELPRRTHLLQFFFRLPNNHFLFASIRGTTLTMSS